MTISKASYRLKYLGSEMFIEIFHNKQKYYEDRKVNFNQLINLAKTDGFTNFKKMKNKEIIYDSYSDLGYYVWEILASRKI